MVNILLNNPFDIVKYILFLSVYKPVAGCQMLGAG